jgi:16S rRNA (guanine527-N7)-methyltransferase
MAASKRPEFGTPSMFPSFVAQTLGEVLDDLGVDADTATRDRLQTYLGLLHKWNAVYNLTAIREPERMLLIHLADCLALLPHLPARAARLLDVGSGGGLPGLVLAIMRPDLQVTLIDAVQKKAAFLTQVVATLRLPNARVLHSRVEDLRDAEGYDLIVCRAFAALELFVRLTQHLRRPGGGRWLAMKAHVPEREWQALQQAFPQLRARIVPLDVPGLPVTRCLIELDAAPPAD